MQNQRIASNKTILIVDDELIIANDIASKLNNNGYKTIVKGNAVKAIEAVTCNGHIDLILMDINLGRGMSGTDAATEILKKKEVPIVFFSAHSDREIVDKVRSITRYGYVVKSSGDFVLLSSIEMALKLFETYQELKENEKQLKESNEDFDRINEELNQSNEELLETNEELVKAFETIHFSESRQKKYALLLSDLITDGFYFEENWKDKIKKIVERSAKIFKTERTSVWIYQDNFSKIVCEDLFELSSGKHSSGYELLSENFPNYTQSHQQGKVIAVEDVFKDNRTKFIPHKYYNDNNIKSLLDAPIWQHGNLTGIISFENTGSYRKWRPDEEQIAVTISSFISNCFEVIEKKVTEAKLKHYVDELEKANIEKSALVNEIHHRVKNNMLVIHGMLNLQKNYIKDEQAKKCLEDCGDRIITMSIIHEHLYRKDDLTKIDMKEYIEELLVHIKNIYTLDKKEIIYKKEFDKTIYLPISKALPVGLIINEIISNSFKHAFVEMDDGIITISFKHYKNKFKLNISDNGKGFETDIAKKASINTYGMKIISLFISQLNASFKFKKNHGTEFELIF